MFPLLTFNKRTLGWLFGGIVALEAFHQLTKLGFTVKGLILIDSPLPINHIPLPKQ